MTSVHYSMLFLLLLSPDFISLVLNFRLLRDYKLGAQNTGDV